MDEKKLKAIKYKVQKIAVSMKKIEDAATSEIVTHDDYLQVCGAMLAVCRNMYVSALGIEGAANMFAAVAETFIIQEEVLNELHNLLEKPTLH
jgi:hypothetical protein|tara:strand:+ start:2133 stop:2411 length:279 start_codon:yes stop_codon:yes gene_type:complete